MKDADMYDDITAYNLSINTEGEIILPREAADYFGNELIIVCAKDKLSLYTSQGWTKKEEELTRMLHDKPEYAPFLRLILGSVCTHQLYGDGRIQLADSQQEHIEITCPGTAALLNMDGSYSLVNAQTAEKLLDDIEQALFN